MNKNYLIISGVVVLLLLGGAGFVFKHQIKVALMGEQTAQTTTPASPAPTPDQTQNIPSASAGATMESVEVDYTSTGFSPATVTIKKGGTVKFVNKSGNQMDVASNPHPVHTDYPGFDQGKSDAAGKDEYDFAFDKVGTWGYHNHANPSDGGAVVVTE